MDFELMHKDVYVATVSISSVSGAMEDCFDVCSLEHMPPGTVSKGMFLDKDGLRNWWGQRSIPVSRTGVRNLMYELGIQFPSSLLPKSMGLSLSDHYWIRRKGSGLSWGDVNFFDNPFTEDIGELLFGNTVSTGSVSFDSPDSTTEGNVIKRWRIIDGERVLFKGGGLSLPQEPFNEVAASMILEALGADHVPYELVWEHGYPYSVCKNFVNEDSELVTAHHVMRSFPNRTNTSRYLHYVDCCERMGVDVVPSLNRMIVSDYIIGNVDRHFNNFGILRNPDTLEWMGPAPVYDSGASLGVFTPEPYLGPNMGVESRGFTDTMEGQLSLVSDFSWIDVDALEDAVERASGFVCDSIFLSERRKGAVAEFMRSRFERIRILSTDSR